MPGRLYRKDEDIVNCFNVRQNHLKKKEEKGKQTFSVELNVHVPSCREFVNRDFSYRKDSSILYYAV